MRKSKNDKFYCVSTADLIKLMNAAMNADEKSVSEIIGIDEVCKITGLSKHTIYKKTSNREIPFYKSTLSRRSVLRFRRSEIENWILKYRIGTVDEFLDVQDDL